MACQVIFASVAPKVLPYWNPQQMMKGFKGFLGDSEPMKTLGAATL